MSRRRKRDSRWDEPDIDHKNWVAWGDELVMPFGFTEGGVPYGVTMEEHYEYTEVDARRRHEKRLRAKDAIRAIFVSDSPDSTVPDVGRVRRMGKGLSREVFAGWVDFPLEPHRSGTYAALLPSSDADSRLVERTRREAVLLRRLEDEENHLHELGLAAGWYLDALRHPRTGGACRQELDILRGILRRAKA